MTAMVTASTVIAYALYTFTAENLPTNHTMMLTIPFVAYGIFRYLYLSLTRNEGGSPEEVLLKDVPLILTIVGWVAAVDDRADRLPVASSLPLAETLRIGYLRWK